MDNVDFAKIDLLVLDVDGVLTDGRIVLTGQGEEIKVFNARDGAAIKWWQRSGRKAAIITGRSSPVVTARAAELGIDAVRLGAKDKLPVYREVLAQCGTTPGRTAVIGDDLPDLPLLLRCAFSSAPCDAVTDVLERVAFVSRFGGGAGCVREVIELMMKKTGAWEANLARYLVADWDPKP